MAAKLTKVMILTGVERPDFVRNVGWFGSIARAEAWCEREGLGQTPVEGEWAVVPRCDDEVHVLPPRSEA